MRRANESGQVLLALGALILAASSTALGESYTITDINLGNNYSFGYGINDAGHVTGGGYNAKWIFRAFLYKDGVTSELPPLSTTPWNNSVGLSLNKTDQVTGQSSGEDPSHIYPLNGAFLATNWNNGTPANLGYLPGSSTINSYGYHINDAGEVVGFSTSNVPNNHAFHWKNGVMTALGTLGGTESEAYAINNKGQIVGAASEANAQPVPGLPSHQMMKPALWDNGTVTCLCNGEESMEGGAAYAINENGQIVGHCKNWDANNVEHREAVVWQGGEMLEIGALGGADGDAWGNNEAGQVVGWAETASGVHHAFLWQNGTMLDLNSLLPANSGWELDTAFDINNNGQIVGYGKHAGQVHAFILNPIVTNKAPLIVGGPSASPSLVILPNTTTVNVLASDPDSGPNPLAYTWTKLAGPGTVSFSPNGTTGSASSTVSFTAAGSYTLGVTISDGAASVSGSVVVSVNAASNKPPAIVSAPWANPNPVAFPNNTTVNVIANDPDGGPQALTYTWSKLSGPGTATFSPNGTSGSGSSSASFSATGSYVLQVTVSDGAASVTGSLNVTVLDLTPPSVDVTSVVLRGAVDGTGSAVVSVTVNGQAAVISGNTWSLEVPVVTGTNTYTIVAKDQGGNLTSKSVSVTK